MRRTYRDRRRRNDQTGSDYITFHVECSDEPFELIKRIRDLGKKAGISIHPDTPAEKIYPFLEKMMEEGKYVFAVDKRANKIQVAQAVAEIFNVKVVSVNTMNVMGKKKRVGRSVGRRPSYKKAIVKLAPGETIQFFEA